MPPFQYDQSGELIGLLQRLNSPGFMMMYGGTSTPGGWLFCDGSVVEQADFPDLFLVIGTNFNTGGEGPTEFRLPDFRSRSPIGVGQGAGLSNYVLGQIGGEETHQLLISEMPIHTHLQNAHTHLQDAHTHLQNSHNHLQDAHTHLQNAHTHTQNAHTHTQDAHNHIQAGNSDGVGRYGYATVPSGDYQADTYGVNITRSTSYFTSSTTATNQNTTAVNQNTTAVNQNTTAVNNAETAVNQNTTAVNQDTTATNNNEGGDGSHNTLHPYLAVNFIIKY